MPVTSRLTRSAAIGIVLVSVSLADAASVGAAMDATGPQLPLINTQPVGTVDLYSTPYGTDLVVAAPGVLANDIDLDGDTLTAVLVSGPSDGTLALYATGRFRYVPDSGSSGIDTFSYRANDGEANSLATLVTITVGAPPPATPTPSPTPTPTPTPTPSPAPTLPPFGSALPSTPPLPSLGLPTPTPGPGAMVDPDSSAAPSAPLGAGGQGTTGGGSSGGGSGGQGPAPSGEPVGGPIAAPGLDVVAPSGGIVTVDGFAAFDSTIEWLVPTAVFTVPGLIIILAVLAGQWLSGLLWLPLVRRSLAGDGRRRRLSPDPAPRV